MIFYWCALTHSHFDVEWCWSIYSRWLNCFLKPHGLMSGNNKNHKSRGGCGIIVQIVATILDGYEKWMLSWFLNINVDLTVSLE